VCGPVHVLVPGSAIRQEVMTVQDTRPENDAAVGPRWVKSSLSFANGDCVEVARLADMRVGVRHSQDPAGPVLRFTPAEWAAFTSGEFTDLPLAG
jgi:hypothetical protein